MTDHERLVRLRAAVEGYLAAVKEFGTWNTYDLEKALEDSYKGDKN